MKHYHLREIETGRIIHLPPISFSGLTDHPDDIEHQELLWQAAVEDGVVNKNLRHKYRFEYTEG